MEDSPALRLAISHVRLAKMVLPQFVSLVLLDTHIIMQHSHVLPRQYFRIQVQQESVQWGICFQLGRVFNVLETVLNV